MVNSVPAAPASPAGRQPPPGVVIRSRDAPEQHCNPSTAQRRTATRPQRAQPSLPSAREPRGDRLQLPTQASPRLPTREHVEGATVRAEALGRAIRLGLYSPSPPGFWGIYGTGRHISVWLSHVGVMGLPARVAPALGALTNTCPQGAAQRPCDQLHVQQGFTHCAAVADRRLNLQAAPPRRPPARRSSCLPTSAAAPPGCCSMPGIVSMETGVTALPSSPRQVRCALAAACMWCTCSRRPPRAPLV